MVFPPLPGQFPAPPPMPGLFPPPVGSFPPPPGLLPFTLVPPRDEPKAADPAADRQPKRKRPSEDDIRKKADRIVEYWNLRDTRMDEDYALYRLSRAGFEGSGEVVIRNIIYAVVEKTASLLGKQKPHIDIIPPRNDLREESQEVEDFLRYQWTIWGDEWADTLHNALLRDVAHYLALRGWASLRIIYDSDTEDGNPVHLKPVDPRQVYPSVGDHGLQYVVHRYWTTISEFRDEWPEAERLYKDVEDDEELIEVTAYYDDWWHGVFTEKGMVKKPTDHAYGFVPWIIGTGMGAPIRATTTNTGDWVKEVGVSVFHGIKDTYKQLNKVLSQLATEMAKSANPATLYYYDPNNPEEPQPLKTAAGAVNYLMYDRERVEPLRLSPSPADTAPLISALQDDIHMGALPPSLWGAGGAGSGYATSLMMDSAEDQLYPLKAQMERIIRLGSKYALTLIRDLHDGEVGYWVKDRSSGRWQGGVTLGPDLIKEVGTEVRVIFKSIAPRDKQALSQLAAMLTKEKLVSMETARDEYLDLDNPGRENERVLTDLIYLDDDVVKVMVEAALARSEPELHALYLQSKARAQQQQPPPGPPPGMGGPPGLGPPGLGNGPPLGAPPGFPPQMMPPIQQSLQQNPLAGLIQSLGSAAGGAGLQRPPGIPGAGALPPPPMPGLL